MGRKEIRMRIQAEYESAVDNGGWEAVGRSWGLSGGMVWRIANESDYWPADPEIRKKIEKEARKRGLYLNHGGRRQDLFSLDPDTLRWQLENRVEV